MQRYLRLLDFDVRPVVNEMSFQLSKFVLNDSKFLDYRPSQLAACSVLISINIYKRD